jgi:uncharacterized protein YidB (DUF937 family)
MLLPWYARATIILKEGNMGLLDGLAKGLLGKVLGGGGSQNPLMDIVLGLITNPQTGGLQGLIQTFKEKGLGDAVSSWISTGENQSVSGGQIQRALGGNFIQQIAEQLGSSKSEVSGGLANLLPEIIDKLTPNGSLPESDQLNQGLELLKQKFFKT